MKIHVKVKSHAGSGGDCRLIYRKLNTEHSLKGLEAWGTGMIGRAVGMVQVSWVWALAKGSRSGGFLT